MPSLGIALGLSRGGGASDGPTPSAPSVLSNPSISGTATEGETLTATTGAYSGYPTPSKAYQWQRNDGGWGDIAGETGSTYVLTSDDVGHTVRVKQTATNTEGNVSAYSSASATVAAAPSVPVNSVAPAITGDDSYVGTLWTCDTGTWTNVPWNYGYQWTRDGVNIGGANANTYTLTEADGQAEICCVVTASNEDGDGAPEPSNAITAYGNLYFLGSVNDNANTLGNWWLDASGINPALALPRSNERVFILADIDTPFSSPKGFKYVQLAGMVSADLGNITTFEVDVDGVALGSFSVTNIANVSGQISGTLNASGTTVDLSSGAANYGIIVGNIITFNSAVNSGTAQGDAVFNGTGENASGGEVTGNAVFNNFSANNGSVDGNSTFNDSATQTGSTGGTAEVYTPAPNPLGGSVTGTITYHGYDPQSFSKDSGPTQNSPDVNTGLDLSWTESVGATSYLVELFSGSDLFITSTTTSSLSVVNVFTGTLNAGSTYKVKVTSSNTYGSTVWSNGFESITIV